MAIQSIFIGDTFTSVKGVHWEVVEYITSLKIKVRSENGNTKLTSAENIRLGRLKDEFAPSVHGRGYVGIGEYTTTTAAKDAHSKARVAAWRNMLRRCYCEKFLAQNPTYVGCTVHPEWLNFQGFAEWFDANYVEGFQLDKDLLVPGNTEYSSQACAYRSAKVNNFISWNYVKTTDNLPGVSFQKGRYFAYGFEEYRKVSLGGYDTAVEAFEAYATHKHSLVSLLETDEETRQLIHAYLDITFEHMKRDYKL